MELYKIKNFITRTIVSMIGIPIIFLCTYYGGGLFNLMIMFVSILCSYEYFNIINKYHPYKTLSIIISSVFSFLLNYTTTLYNIKICLYIVCIMFILFVIEICHGVDTLSVVRILLSFFGIFFIPMTLMHIILIRNLYYGRAITLFTFIITWTVDSMAYIIGSLYGKHKLVKNISPKKTIEGAISGTICGLLVAILLQYTYSFNNILSLPMTITLGCIISIIGQFSDIAESIIKRDNQIKNSSCLIPGHGGILDRFDSYIFVAPSVYYLLTICYKF